jgi:3-oxoadipate enol-lactonase
MAEFVMPWTPPGLIVRIEGRGEFFVRRHRHHDADRPTVLLLHGWTASSDLQFVTAYRVLCAEYHVVGLDHRGHGRGLRSPEPFQLEDVADDAAEVCRTLGVERVIALGYSMGGPLTLLLARRHPDLVAGIVVQATALEWRATAWDRAKWGLLTVAGPWLRSRGHRWYLNRTVPRLFEIDSEWRPFAPWLVSEMARNDPHAVVEAGRGLSRYDARPWAAELDVPAGALITTRDHLVRPSRQRVLAATMRATVRELAADHLATLTDADEYARLTMELLAVVAQKAAASSSAPTAPVPP